MRNWNTRGRLLGTLALGLLISAVVVSDRLSSADHIDAPITTSDADADINDMFVFTNPADDSRVVFGMTVRPLIAPDDAATVRFPSDIMYQWKIDTNADAVEDLVIQALVVDDGSGQRLIIRGPAQPASTGTSSMELTSGPVMGGRVSGASETFVINEGGMQAFAGVRDDPFYIDLTQLLAILAGEASSFNDPGTDTLEGLNTLAIVVEVPRSLIGASNIGVWATSSRATS